MQSAIYTGIIMITQSHLTWNGCARFVTGKRIDPTPSARRGHRLPREFVDLIVQIHPDLTRAVWREQYIPGFHGRVLSAEDGGIGAIHDADHAPPPVRADVEHGLGRAPDVTAA